jgi:hypothetical protein
MAKTGARSHTPDSKKSVWVAVLHVVIAAEAIFTALENDALLARDADIWDEMLLETYKVLIYWFMISWK